MGFSPLLRSCVIGVLSFALGEVRPADVQSERDAWAEHFRLVGEGSGLVAERVWDNVPSYSPMDVVWGAAPAPMNFTPLCDRCP